MEYNARYGEVDEPCPPRIERRRGYIYVNRRLGNGLFTVIIGHFHPESVVSRGQIGVGSLEAGARIVPITVYAFHLIKVVYTLELTVIDGDRKSTRLNSSQANISYAV